MPTGILGAGLAVATVETVVWIQQAQGSYGTFDSGATGPVLLVGGVVGMLAGGVVLYVSRDTSVSAGMTARGPVVGEGSRSCRLVTARMSNVR
jgi:hypothetical protein